MNKSACSQNSKLINGVLKDELGFQGFVVTDWLAHQSGVASTLAGLDMWVSLLMFHLGSR